MELNCNDKFLGVGYMIGFLESLSGFSHLVLLFCSFIFYRRLKRAKQERKLTRFESVLMVLILLGVFSWFISFVFLQTQ